ncbi:RidA family protein [Microbacterium aoyamense]|uniref:RidA family protein n=1 Tax=Microbacterium aoyamense TaxID=344166 RepID=A0ABP5B3L4_9MICO|nr:RidA family protein [Microbacterium aoyamense]
MPVVTLIRSNDLAKTPGYAYGSAIAAGSTLIHLAGSCPLDADGSITPVGDFAGQTARCLANMLTALRASGAELTDVAYTRVLVASTDTDDLGTVWSVVRETFGDHEVPSTLFGVTVLGYRHQLVEIEAVAGVPG